MGGDGRGAGQSGTRTPPGRVDPEKEVFERPTQEVKGKLLVMEQTVRIRDKNRCALPSESSGRGAWCTPAPRSTHPTLKTRLGLPFRGGRLYVAGWPKNQNGNPG